MRTSGRNACPGAEILGQKPGVPGLLASTSQCLPRGRNSGTLGRRTACNDFGRRRNACPGAEILGQLGIALAGLFLGRRNACPEAEILGLPRRTWTRERTPTSRNACPGAEILGQDMEVNLLDHSPSRNACPGAEILGRFMAGPAHEMGIQSQCLPRGRNPGTRQTPRRPGCECVVMPAQGRKSWDVPHAELNPESTRITMPAQGQKSWDTPRSGRRARRSRSQCLPRGRNPGTPSHQKRNARE